MSPKMPASKKSEKSAPKAPPSKNARDAFNQRHAPHLAPVPAPEPEPDDGDDAPWSGAEELNGALADRDAVAPKRQGRKANVSWVADMRTRAKRVAERMRYYAAVLGANDAAVDDSKRWMDVIAQCALSFEGAMTEALKPVGEKYEGTEPKGGTSRGGGRAPLAVGTAVRVSTDAARKRFAALVEKPDDLDKGKVAKLVDGGKLVVDFPGGGRALVKRAEVEPVAEGKK